MKPIIFFALAVGTYGARLFPRDDSTTPSSTGTSTSTDTKTSVDTKTSAGTRTSSDTTTSTNEATKTDTTSTASTSSATATAQATCDLNDFSMKNDIGRDVSSNGADFCRGKLDNTPDGTQLVITGNQEYPTLLCISSDGPRQVQFWAISNTKGKDSISFDTGIAKSALSSIADECCKGNTPCAGHYIPQDHDDVMFALASINSGS